ncbi:MAG: cadherin domain-containing protein, partial [Pseudomonadota bacterium]
MSSFDQSGVTGLIGLWEFSNGNPSGDTGRDDGLSQNGTFENGAFATAGRAVFDGHNDRFDVDGDHGGPLESEFDLARGVIETQFTSNPGEPLSNATIVNRGEFSDMDTEGWFGIRVTGDGKVIVQHCPIGPNGTRIDAFLDTPPHFFSGGDTINVNYEWDEDTGATATITNVTTGDVFTETKNMTGLTLDIGDDDDEIFTFGAREEDDGHYDQHFDGTIDYVAVYDAVVPPSPDGVVDGEAFDEDMVLDYDDSNAPTDGGGDLITNGDDVIFGNGGSDTIDGAAGDDTIFGDSEDVAPVDRQIFEWGDAPGFAHGAAADGFTQGTGEANITFSIISQTGDVTNTYETTTQNTDGLDADVAETESFDSLLRNEDDTATYGWSSDVPVENVEFRINDIDGDGVVQVRAFDPDGNPIDVVLSDVGSDLSVSDTDSVAGNDQAASIDDDYTPDSDGIHSLIVSIPGPVGSWEVIHSMSGDNDSGINFTDITFDIAQPDLGVPGNDVITGGAGADVMFGQDGDDTFIVANAADGEGDVVDGGHGPDDSTDNDTLDLRGAGQVKIDDDVDPNDDGARAGTVTFESGEVLTFSGIETILTDPQNEAPDVIASDVTIDENTTPVLDVDAIDPDGDDVIFSITGGDDAALFEIDPITGQLDFINAPDFENPGDADGDNQYEVEVTATDPGGLFDTQPITVTVADVNESPDVTGPATVDVDENVTGVIADFDATDPDAGDSVNFSLMGNDAALFDIDPVTGELSFITPPDFENPADADGDNKYEVTVVGTDNGGLTDERGVVITVGDVLEADGIVDGEEDGELMGPGYDDSNAPTDQGGDIIDGPDGLDDVIEGNGGDDIIDSGEGNDTVDGGSGDDIFDINDEGEGIDKDVITGGETGETDGDTVDTTDIDDDLSVTFTGDEEGTITDGIDTTTFEEIENLELGGGDD